MPKGDRKPIASIQVFESEAGDNYEIEGYVRVGGIKLEFDTDLNRVRDFFTKRKEQRGTKKPHLKSVDKE